MKIIILLLLLANCHDNHSGYNFKNIGQYETKVGVTTKDEIIAILGEPTIKDDLTNTIFYLSQEDKRIVFFRHIMPHKKYLVMKFDRNNILTKYNKQNLD